MSCCGCIFRLLLLVLLLCFTACMVLSSFFAQFRSTTEYTGDTTMQRTVTYWYHQSKVVSGADVLVKSRVYPGDLQCAVERDISLATCILSVAAAALGALAALFTIFWMLPCCRCAMGTMVFLFTLLAGLCCAAVFGMLTWGFFRGFCADTMDVAVVAYADDGYKMVEGYVLLCVAGAGFVVMALFEAIGYCCVCCCCTSSARKPAAESPSEPTHEDHEKEVPSYDRSTSDNTPYANKKE